MLLASQAEGETRFSGLEGAGEDILSCIAALRSLGVPIESQATDLVVHGVGVAGFRPPLHTIDCGNSATLLRMLAVFSSNLDFSVRLDGDASLQRRDFSSLIAALDSVGVETRCPATSGRAPIEVCGPWRCADVQIDASGTSQVLSGFILGSFFAIEGMTINLLSDNQVSEPYSDLSIRIAAEAGCDSLERSGNALSINAWRPTLPTSIQIPVEESLAAMAMLTTRLHSIPVEMSGTIAAEADLGVSLLESVSSRLGLVWTYLEPHILLEPTSTASRLELDLSARSDLLTPVAALMGLAAGGCIRGISHVRNKESDRIESTCYLLEEFSIEAVAVGDELYIESSLPKAPSKVVQVFQDHRIQLVAELLCSRYGGRCESVDWYRCSFPGFSEILEHLNSCVTQVSSD